MSLIDRIRYTPDQREMHEINKRLDERAHALEVLGQISTKIMLGHAVAAEEAAIEKAKQHPDVIDLTQYRADRESAERATESETV